MFLEPLGASLASPPAELADQAKALGTEGGLVLALGRGHEIVALAEIEIVSRTGIDELMAAAHDAGMRVVIAANDDSVLEGVPATT